MKPKFPVPVHHDLCHSANEGKISQPYMCKEEHRWESLKRGITLHLSLILEKVNLLNFFFLSLSGKAKTIFNKRNHETTTPFLNFSSVFNV